VQHTSGQTGYTNLNGLVLHEVSPFSDIYVQLDSETGLPANNTRYIFNGSDLVISIDGSAGGTITIENFNPQSNSFGLTFNDYIAATPPDQTNTEILSGTEIDDYLDLTVAYESSGQLWGQVYGGDGHDYINGTEQSDEIYGGAGDDLVWGNLSA